MRDALSFMIIFVFLSLSIPQQGIAMLELIDQADVTPVVLESNLVKIIVLIPLHKQKNSVDKVTNINGVKLSLNILKMLLRFVSESNNDDEQNQETGLSKMIDTINKDNECPVTVSSDNNDFNFMMIKQPNDEYLGILSIKPTSQDTFICSPKLLSVDKMLSLVSIKTTAIDSQENNQLLQIDNCSTDMLKKYHLRSSEDEDDTCFILYIPCKVKGAAADDNLSSYYAAFVFRQKQNDLLEALNRLSTLNDDDNDIKYEEETQWLSTLMQVPLEVKEHILKLLSFRELITLRLTCATAKRLIDNNKKIFFKAWFSCFTPQKRLSLKKYIETTTESEIYALVTQFSTETDIAKDLVMTHDLNYHTEIVCYTISRLMNCCPAFSPDKILSTTNFPDYDCTATFSPDDSYVAIHYDNISLIYELGMNGRSIHMLNPCAKFNVGTSGYHIYKSLFRVTLALFSACNRYLIICRYNGSGEIYEMHSDGKWTKKIIFNHYDYITSATFSPDSRHVVTTSKNRQAKIHRLDSGLELSEEVTIKHKKMSSVVIFSNNGRSVLTSSIGKNTKENKLSGNVGLIKIHELSSDGQWTEKLSENCDSQVFPKCFSLDGRYAMTIVGHNTARIYELDSCGEWLQKPSIDINHNNKITSARFSPNGRHLATASRDFTVKIYGRYAKKDNWSKEEWSEQATISHKNYASSATFSRDGSHLITSSDDGSAIIYGLVAGETWKKKATISICGDNCLVRAIFSDDSSHALVFSPSNDNAKIVKIYKRGQNSDDEWMQKALIQELRGIKSASFSADGNHIITASNDDIVHIYGWTADNKLQTKATIQHDKYISSARFTHDCSHVVVIDVDTSIHIWRLFLDRRN